MHKLLIPALGLLLWTTLASAADGPQRLNRFLEGLNTLQAQFQQTVISAGHDQAIASKGTFYLKRPGRFRWTYDEPEGQLVIADGNRVWLYDAELEQVSHQSQEEALRGTPALLLSGSGPVESHFEVVGLGSRIGLEWVELLPRGENSEIIKVLVAFRGDQLDRLEMIDSFGQISRFHFADIRRNPELDPALFRFEPPPGIDMLER
jgi:outer membrane lipoprotein carrier protein